MKYDMTRQYCYFKSPVYCSVDMSCNPADEIWILTDGCLDAPEAIPTGSLVGKDKWGTVYYKNFVPRYQEPISEKAKQLVLKVIDELLKELAESK